MAETGGPTTQSGILYQNSVAALYLGRLLDSRKRPDNEKVVHIRVEAPEHVDDIVVRFADEHRFFIQAKENVKSSSDAWRTMWKHFDQQFRNADFQRKKDRLLLQIGKVRDNYSHLEEMCDRARTSKTVTEWHRRLTKAQYSLLVDKIKPALPPAVLTNEYLLHLLGHIDVEIVPLRTLERDYLPHWMPKTNKLPIEIFRLLRDRVGGKSRVRGSFTASKLLQSLTDESPNLKLDVPIDIVDLQTSVKQCSSLLRQHKHTFADTNVHIEREIVDQIVEWLLAENDVDKNVAMLLDQAGMGKTVVMQRVLHQLETQEIDVLAIKADQQLSTVTLLSEIQHQLALVDPAEQIITRLAQLNRVVVLIDQIDALSLSLAHDQKTLDTTLDFIARLQRIPNVRILLSCRIFDRNTDPRLKRIKIGRSFSLEPLHEDQILAVLNELNVDAAALSQTTLELLRVPLHLDLFARAVKGESTIEQLRGISSLQELYALIWQNVILKQQAGSPTVADRIQVINQLTSNMNREQRTSVPHSFLQTAETSHLEHAVNWLASIGILLYGKTDWTFFHQTFFDYCYARQFVESGGNIVSTILVSKQRIIERPKLTQIIAYLRGNDHNRYIRDLKLLLNSSDLRFHLFDLLVRWFGSLRNPTDDEWLIAQQMLNNEQRRWHLLGAMNNNVSWFNLIRPFLVTWLSHDDQTIIRQALSYLTSIIETNQVDVVSVVKPFLDKDDEWNQRIGRVLSRIKVWQSEEAIELFESVIYKETAVDRHLFWHISNISETFPEAGCRIIHFVFDFVLTQFADLQESDRENRSTMFSSGRLFDRLRNSESALIDALEKVSKSKPKIFSKIMVPWVIKVVTINHKLNENNDRYTSDPLSHNWYGDTFRIQLTFVHSLVYALRKIAQSEPDYFQKIAEELKRLPSKTPQQLLTHIYRALPELYADDAFEFLVADSRRLNIGNDQYDSRQVISAIYPHLTNRQRQQLEAQILNYAPIHKVFGLRSLKWWGIEQYHLLHDIPEPYLSQEGKRRSKEWKRKFADYEILDNPKPIVRGGIVGPPISEEQAQKMSNRSWLRAMRKYQGSTGHQDFLKGGARQLSPVLLNQIKNDPERFHNLYQLVPDDIDDSYATAFINGFAESTSPRERAFDVIRSFATQKDRNIKQPAARAVEKLAKSEVPDDIIDLLSTWVHDSVNDDETWWAKGDNHGDAFSSYLNSDRGAAFSALMRVLDAKNTEDFREKKWELIEFVASDPSTALRIGAIHELTYMIQYDRPRAWSLFEQLIIGHNVLMEAHYVREFLYWSFYRNFSQVSRFIEMMMHYPNEEVQKQGAGLACLAAISYEAMESDEALAAAQELADQALDGSPAWRRGAAHIYSYNMTHGSTIEVGQLCKEKVCKLIDDEDKGVRAEINQIFYGLAGNHFFELRDFLEEYALAENHPLDHQIAEYLWTNGMQDPSWSLTIVQTLLQKGEQPDQWDSGIEELMRLILRIYTSPTVAYVTKDEALDTFDLLMQRYAGTANKILSEWDRR